MFWGVSAGPVLKKDLEDFLPEGRDTGKMTRAGIVGYKGTASAGILKGLIHELNMRHC